MRLYWIAYQIDGKILVVIQPGKSLVHARMKVALASLGATYIDGHELDDKKAVKVPKTMTGRPLSRNEAAKLQESLERQ